MELLNEVYAQAAEILRVTALVELTGNADNQEKEVSDFIFLMEKREPMLKRLAALKKKAGDMTEAVQAEACARRAAETEHLLKQIIVLDKAHLAAMERIKASVKSSIKGINSGKKLSHVYAHPSEQGSYGLFDTKK